jgi:hypothetical protein
MKKMAMRNQGKTIEIRMMAPSILEKVPKNILRESGKFCNLVKSEKLKQGTHTS